MAVYALLALQLVAFLGGFVFLLRRLDRQSAEIVSLRAQLEAKAAPRARRAAAGGKVVSIAPDTMIEEPASTPSLAARAADLWRTKKLSVEKALALSTLSPETGRLLALVAMAAAPAIGFLFGADPSATVTSGLSIAAAMMLIALRPNWVAAAWASVLAAAAWAAAGYMLNVEPVSFSLSLALAAIAGLLHAHLRRAAPGSAMALLMAATALALGAKLGMVGAGGIAFGVIIAASAVVGAMSLRLEAIHLVSFGAGLIGLFVLTGQESAAIWFTPAVAWLGAWFFAIGVIRAPQLGAQGGAIAGTAALGPIIAAGGLHLSEHGLSSALAASGAFAGVAVVLSGLIALCALRDNRGLGELRLTLWILALSAFFAAAYAILIIAPPTFAAPAFAALAVGLIALDMRAPDTTWRAFACASALFAAGNAFGTAEIFFAPSAPLPGAFLVVIGLALPAVLAGAGAYLAKRNQALKTAGLLEGAAIFMGVMASSLLVRAALSGGVPALSPIGFVEAGMHVTLWLIAALALALRARRGAVEVRHIAIATLSVISLATLAFSTFAWLTPFWSARTPDAPLLQHAPLGFALPAMLAWLHWAYWRRQGLDMRTRVAFAAAAALTACFITLEAFQMRAAEWEAGPDWLSIATAAVSFALAVGLNFAPFVIDHAASPQLDLEEYLKRDRRSHQRV